MHSEKCFCQHKWVEKKIQSRVQPAILIRKKNHQFLTEFALNINSCFIQYNAPFVEYIIVAQ